MVFILCCSNCTLLHTSCIVSEKQDIIRTVSIDSTESLSPKDDSPGLSPIIKPQTEHVWKGTINMVDVAQISITAHEVSGIVRKSFFAINNIDTICYYR